MKFIVTLFLARSTQTLSHKIFSSGAIILKYNIVVISQTVGMCIRHAAEYRVVEKEIMYAMTLD